MNKNYDKDVARGKLAINQYTFSTPCKKREALIIS